jgi:hypothetical protein
MLKYELVLCACIALMFIGVTDNVSARSDTAVHGYARGADRNCFDESWGAMLNNCSTTKQLFIPASIDKHCVSGSSWKVTAQSNNVSSNVCCRMIGIQGTSISAGSWQCLPQFGSPQQMTLNGASVSQNRALYVCEVGPGAKVIGIDWAQSGNC